MNGFVRLLALAAVAALAIPLAAQQEVPMRNNTPVAPQGIKIPPLPETPVRYETAEGQTIKVGVYARGFQNPWSMAFVSDDTILVAERGGAIKAVRNGVVDPTPVQGGPRAIGAGLSGTDLALHPDFARNRLVYISYTKPLDPPAGAAPAPAPAPVPEAGRGGRGAAPRTAVAVAVAVWDGKGFSGTRDIFVGEGGSGGPIVFGGDGMLYVAHGGGDTQNPKSLAGKILRLTDEGKVPSDNPFVGRADARPEIFTMGHRTFLRMAKHPQTGAIWQIENGPNGGDEVNILTPASNYGWPLVSLGRTYAGPWQGPLSKEGFKDPLIYWMPAIAVSSIAFYTGDALPKWKGDVFVTGMRYGEIPGTGQLHRILINKNFEELRREPLLLDLKRRYRDVKQGRDGFLYLLTDEAEGVMLRIEPSE
jgi:glucose/arabinose dehydrogenase